MIIGSSFNKTLTSEYNLYYSRFGSQLESESVSLAKFVGPNKEIDFGHMLTDM